MSNRGPGRDGACRWFHGDDQRDHQEGEEQEEKSGAGAAEAEHAGNDGDDEKEQGVLQHWVRCRRHGWCKGSRMPAGWHRRPQAAAREPSSKNSAWLISAFTMSGLNGLVTRKVGSGRSPVSSRSGNAVMKITGIGWVCRMSLTASMPDEPSASWISARIMRGWVL